MGKVNEPRTGWGGNWTEIKLEAFEKYPDEIAAIEAKLNNDAAKRKKENIKIENCDCHTLLRKYLQYV